MKYLLLFASILCFNCLMAQDKPEPVFPEEWQKSDSIPGIEYRISEPFFMVDDLSGEEQFYIAMELKKKPEAGDVKFIYFNVKVYDDQGILEDRERQQHYNMYDLSPQAYMKKTFPDEYQGINYDFWTKEKYFADYFEKIEVELSRVERPE